MIEKDMIFWGFIDDVAAYTIFKTNVKEYYS